MKTKFKLFQHLRFLAVTLANLGHNTSHAQLGDVSLWTNYFGGNAFALSVDARGKVFVKGGRLAATVLTRTQAFRCGPIVTTARATALTYKLSRTGRHRRSERSDQSHLRLTAILSAGQMTAGTYSEPSYQKPTHSTLCRFM